MNRDAGSLALGFETPGQVENLEPIGIADVAVTHIAGMVFAQ